MRSAFTAALTLALAACATLDSHSSNSASTSPIGRYSFGLSGDMPYKKAGDDAKLPAVLQSSNASDIAFSLYDGDIKNGSSTCNNNVFTDALTMVVQADPGFGLPETEEFDESTLLQFSGYRPFMQKLAKQTRAFPGEVLFVHGDTHFFKLDKPLDSPTHLLTNFTRLQTFGSPSLYWVKVTVDPASTTVFQVEPVLVKPSN